MCQQPGKNICPLPRIAGTRAHVHSVFPEFMRSLSFSLMLKCLLVVAEIWKRRRNRLGPFRLQNCLWLNRWGSSRKEPSFHRIFRKRASYNLHAPKLRTCVCVCAVRAVGVNRNMCVCVRALAWEKEQDKNLRGLWKYEDRVTRQEQPHRRRL